MSDSSDIQEPALGQITLGDLPLQHSLDANTNSVDRLSSAIGALASEVRGGGGAGPVSSGIAAGAQGQGTATGTGQGGYASWFKRFTPFGRSGGGFGGGGFSSFGSAVPTNGQPGGAGGGSGARGGALGAAAGVFAAAGVYGNAHMNAYMTMNTASTQAMWRSGLAAGGVNASLAAATRMIYGSGGANLNSGAVSIQDAANANAILGYTAGVPMYTASGAANSSYIAAQNSMYGLGYANPYMSQTQIAGAMQQIYAPRSVQAMTQLGVRLPSGFIGPQTLSPMSIAANMFSRTFGGASSVSAQTMAAATAQGGSLDANLRYLGAQAGWSSSTVNALETYLQQRNAAITAHPNIAGSIDSLMAQATRGDKSAISQLAQVGIGSSTVQSVKNLQAAQTSTLADQSGDFNSALQQSTGLLTEFNQALSSILSRTGISGGVGTLAGYGTQFGPLAGSIAAQYAMGKAGQYGAGRISAGWNSLRNRFGRSAQDAAAQAAAQSGAGFEQDALFELPGMAGEPGKVGVQGELFDMPESAVATSAAGESEAVALSRARAPFDLGKLAGRSVAGLAVGSIASSVNDSLWSRFGHTGAGDDWISDVGKGAGTALSYGAAGALIGSAIPVIGTGVGGLIGLGAGALKSLWDWSHNKNGYSAASSSPAVAGGYSSGLGQTGSIGGGTDQGTTSTSGPSGVTPVQGAGNATAATLSTVVQTAVAQQGKPYVYGAVGPDSFDCSGLMLFAYKAGGITLPRTSEQQMTVGSPVDPAHAQPGDLLFPYPGHVMMCIGGGKVIEARHTGTVVTVRSYSPGEFVAARRVISLGTSAGQNAAASGGNAATPGNASSGMTSGLSGLTAGESELQSMQADAANALTGRLSASIRMNALSAAFGVSSLAAVKADAASQAPTNGSGIGPTNLSGSVRDKYGHTYKVPKGKKPAGTVASWIDTALSTLGMPLSAGNITDIKDIIKGESGGDPWSINLTDSNAAAGHPSEGIMQTIPSTFNAYKLGGHGDIWNPVDNIIAGVRYAVKTYKSLDNVPGVKAVKAGKPYVGYAAGAWDLESDQVAALHKGEMVLPKAAAQSVRNAIISDALGAKKAGPSSSGVTLNFRPGSIQITIGGQVSAATAQQTGTAIVDAIVGDPRIKTMAVGQ